MRKAANTILALLRQTPRHLAAVALLTLCALAWSLLADSSRSSPELQTAGWGAESLVESDGAWSPIAAANACGMGASSCFKCHNGKRAAAPKMDRKDGAWHADHKTVNHSCVGCHNGNARIIKKELAHADLLKDPRTKADACAACHKSQDTNALLKAYQQPQG